MLPEAQPQPQEPPSTPKPRFHTTRPALLIPQKRPLRPAKKNPPITPNTTAHPPSLRLAASANPAPNPHLHLNLNPRDQPSDIPPRDRDTECNFAAAPQPFLDPGCWARMRGVDAARAEGGGPRGGHAGLGVGVEEREELHRRRRVRAAEFGGLAVRGRLR
ncbi:hypothetical protein BP00DRAFT_415736 [Aspergillus indologenus CBS 114.80]|uniref:Uncharacterized protein n=1 Tax=Aspergillus indologenus CBS 114.80 TaxID=1450541 RepID=A0A2V5I3B5_9EURO|nr:hypothetical protein BP00DRAFT_415736 [Aspergillus indologenus CBS 114.80]